MKAIILIVMILLVPIFALADGGVYRDRYGNQTGSWSDTGNQRVYRDRDGNTEGSSSRDGDRMDYRDAYGNYEGSRYRDRRDR